MKKTLLSIVALLSLSLTGIGQSFTTMTGSDTARASFHKPGHIIDVKNHLTNKTSSNITITWKVVPASTQISNGWVLSGFCDNITCITPDTNPNFLNGTDVQTSDVYVPNIEGTFYAQFNGDNALNSSSAWITVEAKDIANNHTKNLTYIVTKGALGINTIKKIDEDVILYPNPAKGSVNVIFDGSMGVKNIAIYSLIGKVVSVYKVNGNSAKLDLTDVPSGLYFVRLINSQGKIVATRKFTHQ